MLIDCRRLSETDCLRLKKVLKTDDCCNSCGLDKNIIAFIAAVSVLNFFTCFLSHINCMLI